MQAVPLWKQPPVSVMPLAEEIPPTVVDPRTAPMFEARSCPPVMVTPETVERPPLVEMEMPPVYVDVPVLEALMTPENKASPVEMLSPADEARPTEDSPPEKVDVPVPVETILPPVRRRSPAVDSMPLDTLRLPAVVPMSRPPTAVDVPVPLTVMRLATSTLVVEALGKMLRSVVEVETKLEAVSEPATRDWP